MKSIIGWKTKKGSKKQHLAKYSPQGDVVFFCRETSPCGTSVSGHSWNNFYEGLLTEPPPDMQKCKICDKEVKRINRIRAEIGEELI